MSSNRIKNDDEKVPSLDGIILSIKKSLDRMFSKHTESCICLFSVYVEMIIEWEKCHDIVSKKFSKKDVWENILDSVFLSFLMDAIFFADAKNEDVIIDAGAGGGFPGVPLAIVFRERRFVLVDSDRKKCSFLRSVKARLQLDNITIINKNITTLELAPMLITRAAFPPGRARVLAEAVKKQGKIAIWATPATAAEFIAALKKTGCLLSHQENYELPSGKQRCLLFFLAP